MARNRDYWTKNPVVQMMRGGRNRMRRADGYDENYNPIRSSGFRVQGRRGVRARKRDVRIAQRKANGTYRQPSGGTITNS